METNYLYESYNEETFGSALSLSADGTILTVGASMNSENGAESGRVVRYDLTNPIAYVEVRGNVGDYLGYDVATSKDGIRHALYYSSTRELRIYAFSSGSRSFELTTSFSPQADPASLTFAISGDGQWIAVLGEVYSEETLESSVVLELFEFNKNSNSFDKLGETIILDTYVAQAWGQFDVTLTNDGGHIAASQIGIGEFTGSVRVYERTGAGLELLGTPFVSENSEDDFGRDVEIVHTQGQVTLAYSVANDDMVFTYTLQGNEWVPLSLPIVGLDVLGQPSQFGFDLAFDASATRLVVGAPGYGNDGEIPVGGIAVAFELIDGDWWVVGLPVAGVIGSQLGATVDFDATGSVFVTGAPLDCASQTVCGGSVYVFELVDL